MSWGTLGVLKWTNWHSLLKTWTFWSWWYKFADPKPIQFEPYIIHINLVVVLRQLHYCKISFWVYWSQLGFESDEIRILEHRGLGLGQIFEVALLAIFLKILFWKLCDFDSAFDLTNPFVDSKTVSISTCIGNSVIRKKSPIVYKSCPKKISLQKW